MDCFPRHQLMALWPSAQQSPPLVISLSVYAAAFCTIAADEA